MHIALIVLFGLLLLLAASLQRTYAAVPVRELKRRARHGDEMAAGFYKAVGYGHSLRAILWLLVGLTGVAFFVAAALWLPLLIALGVSLIVLWLTFVWLPASRVSVLGRKSAQLLAPFFSSLLNYLHPSLDRSISFIRRHRPITIHTGLYDTADLLGLIDRQQIQIDNRIGQTKLDIARHALQVGDISVQQVLTPQRMVKMVKADEPVGPLLMAELHDSGHSRFPVYDGKKSNIVGILYLRDLVAAKHTGTVHGLMQPTVCYVHEEQPILEALQAVLKTHQQLFIVVNSFEEYVGVISIEDILEQIIGQPIVDEFDQYQDLRAVAARTAKAEHKDHQEAPIPTVVVDEKIEIE